MPNFSVARNIATVMALFLILDIDSNGAVADSQLPHNTFDGAVNLGGLDFIGPTNSVGGRKLFRCFHRKIDLNFARPPFETFYFKFEVLSEKSRVFIHMNEEPRTSMHLRTYTGERVFMKEYITNPDETVDEVLQRGTYFVQILTKPDSPHIPPHGINIGRLTFQGLAGEVSSDAENQIEPVNLGSLSANNPITRKDALSVVTGRSRTFREDLVNKNCEIGGGAGLGDTRDEFVFTADSGLIRPEITATSDRQNWQRSTSLFYWQEGNLGGAWAPVTGQIRHKGGQLKLHVGTFDPVEILIEDGYVAYQLEIRR